MEPNVPQQPPEQAAPIYRPADQLTPGDFIAPGFLGYAIDSAEVLFTYRYRDQGTSWVMVVVLVDRIPEVNRWRPAAQIPLSREVADPDHGRTTAVAEAKPDTLVVPLGHAAEEQS